MNKSLSVTELTAYIKQLVENDMLLSHLWVVGEISNFKNHSSGHMYFSLKDDSAVIRCVMFRTQNSRLKFRPEEGLRVLVRGYVSVYASAGAYQLYVDEMQPDGTGALYLAFEQLKIKMEKQGLFEASKKKPIPVLPTAIGVITSPTGAVIRDITQILDRRYANSRVVIYGSAVQGVEAPAQLVKGIRWFNTMKNVDVIILARGGGSLEDLWPFNDEKLALTIAESEIPIISAIGHETDFSIADFVADLRAPTPSAAAEMVMPEKSALKEGLSVFEKRLSTSLANRLQREYERLMRLKSVRSFQKPLEIVNRERQHMDMMEHNLIRQNQIQIDKVKSSLRVAAGRLNALSPLTVLSRGYAVAQTEEGKLIRTAGGLNTGDKLILTVADGKFQSIYDKPLK